MYLKSTVLILPYDGKTLVWDRKRDRKIVIHLHFEEFYNQLGKNSSDVLKELLITNQFITYENDIVDLDIYKDVPSYFYIAKTRCAS